MRSPLTLATLLALAIPLAAAADDKIPSPVENSVVKVFATARYPDISKPWTKQGPTEVSGSGVVIEGKRILTNAHVVMYSSQLQVQADQAGDKVAAKVEYLAPSIDLAVLKLDDETFFNTHPPLPRASALPSEKDTVLAYGFPTGGNSLSITKGIVSRIEFTFYNYPVSGLRIQIDAAINPGNSGGPAVVGDRMIGLAFSHLGGAENIGYIIPTEEIELFLQQAATGKPYAKPALYDNTQTLENVALRPYLKLGTSDSGTLVLETDSPDPTYPLKKWDLLSKIGEVPIDDQGMVHQGDLRLDFHYLIQKQAKEGRIDFEIIRSGRRRQVSVPVVYQRPQLMPWLLGNYPKYFVYGPLVFSPACGDFASGLAQNAQAAVSLLFSANPLLTRRSDLPAFPGEELVVVPAPFLPHRLVEGYGNHSAYVVSEVNGIKIRNLSHLVEVLRDAKSEFITFVFAGRAAETLVFQRRKMLEATEEILGDNGIREQGSPEYLQIWSGSGTAKP